mmetsp:Transcript_28214/g.28500  ORF Transcript_28214/g.28500 Transcript_28214/m.28500 type:complete len:258 (+) Transcript_28214:101-874(+)
MLFKFTPATPQDGQQQEQAQPLLTEPSYPTGATLPTGTDYPSSPEAGTQQSENYGSVEENNPPPTPSPKLESKWSKCFTGCAAGTAVGLTMMICCGAICVGITIAIIYAMSIAIIRALGNIDLDPIGCFANLKELPLDSTIYINDKAERTGSFDRTRQPDGRYGYHATIKYDWKVEACSNCFLFLGITDNNNIMPACTATLNETKVYTLVLSHTFYSTGCNKIFSYKRIGGNSCTEGTTPFSGDDIGAIFLKNNTIS